MAARAARPQRGFSLVEMITVIVILGILAIGVSSYVVLGTRVVVDSVAVNQVLDQSRFTMERMTREIRNAVPNSLRMRTDTSGTPYQCLEFVPIEAVANYLSMPIYPQAAALTGLAINTPSAVNAQQLALIYPLRPSEVYTNPANAIGKLFSLATVTRDTSSNTTSYRFDRAVQFAEASPRDRLFLVNQPVSYCFIGEPGAVSLYRFTGYGINHPNQLAPNQMGGGVLMAQAIMNSISSQPPFAIEASTLVSNAMVLLKPTFNAAGVDFTYQQQVQVINVP